MHKCTHTHTHTYAQWYTCVSFCSCDFWLMCLLCIVDPYVSFVYVLFFRVTTQNLSLSIYTATFQESTPSVVDIESSQYSSRCNCGHVRVHTCYDTFSNGDGTRWRYCWNSYNLRELQPAEVVIFFYLCVFFCKCLQMPTFTCVPRHISKKKTHRLWLYTKKRHTSIAVQEHTHTHTHTHKHTSHHTNLIIIHVKVSTFVNKYTFTLARSQI